MLILVKITTILQEPVGQPRGGVDYSYTFPDHAFRDWTRNGINYKYTTPCSVCYNKVWKLLNIPQ